jgi:hypothetical protein
MAIHQPFQPAKPAPKNFSIVNGAMGETLFDRAAPRVRSAAMAAEVDTAAKLIDQLRDIIVGPQTRLNEARFGEMIDILAEQNDHNDSKFSAVERGIEEMSRDLKSAMELFDRQYKHLGEMSAMLEREMENIGKVQSDASDKLRTEFSEEIGKLTDALRSQVDGMDHSLRRDIGDLSQNFQTHVEEEPVKWETERRNSYVAIEQRIAQWRAEIDDTRKQDMADVANSMMDIGRRLMALRQA